MPSYIAAADAVHTLVQTAAAVVAVVLAVLLIIHALPLPQSVYQYLVMQETRAWFLHARRVCALLGTFRSLCAPGLSSMLPEPSQQAIDQLATQYLLRWAPLDAGIDAAKQRAASVESLVVPVRLLDAAASPARVPLLVFRGMHLRPSSVIVLVHGAGLLRTGKPEDLACLAATLATRARSVVVVPDYSHSPKHRYPTAMLEVYAVCVWAQSSAHAHLGLPGPGPVPLTIIGEVAGAAPAVSVALMARDRDDLDVSCVVLVDGMLGLQFDGASMLDAAQRGGLVTPGMLQGAWASYLPRSWTRGRAWEDISRDLAKNHAFACPLAADLTDFPRSYHILAGLSPLQTEADTFARRCMLASADALERVHVRRYPRDMLGFWRNSARHSRADQAVSELASYLRSTYEEPEKGDRSNE